MSIDTAKLDEIERGLEGVTQGPWHSGCLGGKGACQCSSILSDTGIMGAIATVHVNNGLRIGEGGNDAPPEDEAVANMRHIARCDPQTISELVRLARIGLAAERLHASAPECPVCEDDTYVCSMTPDRYCGMETAPPKTGGEDE